MMRADARLRDGQIVGSLRIEADKAAVRAELQAKGAGSLKDAVKGIVLAEPVLLCEGKPMGRAGLRRRYVLKPGKIEVKIL